MCHGPSPRLLREPPLLFVDDFAANIFPLYATEEQRVAAAASLQHHWVMPRWPSSPVHWADTPQRGLRGSKRLDKEWCVLRRERRFIMGTALGPLLQCVDRGEGVQPQIPAQLDQLVLREEGVPRDQPLTIVALRAYWVFAREAADEFADCRVRAVVRDVNLPARAVPPCSPHTTCPCRLEL